MQRSSSLNRARPRTSQSDSEFSSSVKTGRATEARRGILGHPKRLLVLIGSLSIFGPLCIDMYLPAFPTIQRTFHASASLVQLSLTACMVGLGVGQLVIGPLSDRFGRRSPLLLGIVLFVVASLGCSLAPGIGGLIVLRLFQGLGGASGIVISRAVVRDLFSGVSSARFFSMLVLVTGMGPIIAPQIGAGMLRFTSWRGVFLALALTGAVIAIVAAFKLPETLAPENARSDGLAVSLREIRGVLMDRTFVSNSLAVGLGFGATISYVSGSSFVLENIYHLSPTIYGLIFAMNAVGMITGSQFSARVVGRLGSVRLMTLGLSAQVIAGCTLVVAVLLGGIGLPAILPSLFLLMTGMGCAMPNGTAIALNDFPHKAGSASALMGVIQFSIGATVAPLMGIAGSHSAVPMALSILLFSTCAFSLRVSLTRSRSLKVDEVLLTVPETV